MTLSDLRREAQGAAHWRGHNLVWRSTNQNRAYGECRICGASVTVTDQPFYNEAPIMGGAVATDCNRPTRLVKEFDESYILVADSQDIDSTLESIGSESNHVDYGFLFAKLDNSEADYAEVWASKYSVPYLSRSCERIY